MSWWIVTKNHNTLAQKTTQSETDLDSFYITCVHCYCQLHQML